MRLRTVAGVAMLAMIGFFASLVRVVPAQEAPPEGLPPTAERALTTISHPHGQQQEGAPVAPGEHPLLTVPVLGVPRSKITDTWGQARDNGLRPHHGTDIMAPGGTPVVAAAPGTVEKLFYSNGGGGITLYVRSPDRRWSYYYAHLQGYAPGLVEGMSVKAGDPLGFVGDTGNAGTGNFHLHFGLSRMKPSDRWWEGEPVNAYPLLHGT
ncbi:M23 family metallopeptidase [Sphingomonas sp. LB-2]|uniref:M23 family metallopeptidase n=1 Tax=Sphingomonas caeni TaxID=2984949 RepID=UPI0022323544|nr:M23 family metallopeptidase [Sphingomonas caeni]MCW3847808.1 M23 family metallopeptidase [Sphingomonas caeni]